MAGRFFYEQIVNIMCCPIFIYDANGKLLEKIGSDSREWWLWLGYDREKAQSILSEKKEYPVIYTGSKEYTAAVFYDEKENIVLAAGPVMFGLPAEQKAEHEDENRNRKKIGRKEDTPAFCSLDAFVSGCLLLYWYLTGKEMTVCELWDRNRENYEKVRMIRKRISEDMFYRQENFGRHNPGEQELRELESIKNGDREALRDSISETYEGAIGILAKEPLRHYKNVAIGNITLASRAAIQGGVSVENSYSMADSMIQQVEEINNIPEVEAFKRECQYLYAEAVKNEKERGISDAEKNPLVGKVKDYIFSHLHDKIKVADIAEELGVNPNYLTSVFNKDENISIKKYILLEKIRRSQNLLKYAGMTPNEYRRKYGYTEKWK